MSRLANKIYVIVFALIVILTIILLTYRGFSYYLTSLEQRFFHADHNSLKPSGIVGHGLGIIGSFLMLVGVFAYMIRKRRRSLMRLGKLKHWLEFHIFLCTLGPVLILFHSAFKIGGLVAVSFWSMVAVFLSGVIGRFIYIQIPRTIEGRELSLSEVKDLKSDMSQILNLANDLDEQTYNVIVDSTRKKVELYSDNAIILYFRKRRTDRNTILKVKTALRKNQLPREQYSKIVGLVKDEIALNRKIERLVTMQNLFKYWHVAHLPFAIVMFVIMIIHIGVTVAFGFRWIF